MRANGKTIRRAGEGGASMLMVMCMRVSGRMIIVGGGVCNVL